MKARVKDEESYCGCQCDPKPPPARRCMRIVRRCQTCFFFRGPAGISVGINLPSREALTAGLNFALRYQLDAQRTGSAAFFASRRERETDAASYQT
jgi:hypothetical protein